MKTKTTDTKASHVTRGSVFEDIGFNEAEALELKIKSEVYAELLKHIRQLEYTQAELGSILGLHQPDVSKLLGGRASKFSIGKLIQFAGKLNLRAQIKFIVSRQKSSPPGKQGSRSEAAAA